jgi:four helix bundle protein
MTFQERLKARTKYIALETIKLADDLPHKPAAWILSKQIIRSSTSIGASYRAACRAKSTADFINKLKMVEEEADETIYWLELLQETGLLAAGKADVLIKETSEILRIVVASLKTTRERSMSYGHS